MGNSSKASTSSNASNVDFEDSESDLDTTEPDAPSVNLTAQRQALKRKKDPLDAQIVEATKNRLAEQFKEDKQDKLCQVTIVIITLMMWMIILNNLNILRK